MKRPAKPKKQKWTTKIRGIPSKITSYHGYEVIFMFLTGLAKSVKYEVKSLSRNLLKLIVCGTFFVTLAMIILYAGSSPLWMNNFRIFPGGAFCVFVCYLSSVVFFFLCGCVIYMMVLCRKSHRQRAGNAILYIIVAYVFRVLWIILFFGGFSPLFSLVCLISSMLFLIFALLKTIQFSTLVPTILFVMVLFTCIFVVLTLKFMLIP